MQLYAFDDKNEIVSARRGEKGKTYFCLECSAPLRLRGGRRRKRHFYHFQSKTACRQQGKSLTHLAVQQRILFSLPLGEGELERPFPSIGRIADVVWEKERLVFEVQCSSISGKELLSRNYDYARAGYRVVWIFHDSRYNKHDLADAEEAIGAMPHYFTNIFPNGRGDIYDQQSLVKGWRRVEYGKKFPVNLGRMQKNEALPPARFLRLRDACWPCHFAGDLFERGELLNEEQRRPGLLSLFFKVCISRPYWILFSYFLEKYSG